MDIESLRLHCLSLRLATEDMPFGDQTLVFRIGGKIFALMGLDTEGASVNLKCDPEYAVELREKYLDVQPGFHMNKKHWNTVICDGGLDHKLIKSLIEHSYDLCFKSLTKPQREALENL